MSDLKRAEITRWLYATQLPLPYFARTFLVEWLVTSRPTPLTLDDFAVQLELDLSDFLQSRLFIKKNWEPELFKWFVFFAKGGQTFADIGSHIGYFSLLMAHYGQKGTTVHAFEPNPKNFEHLRRNALINKFNIVANQTAIADKSGVVKMNFPHSFQSGVGRIGNLSHAQYSMDIKAMSLDEYCKNQSISKFDFVKIDIEGGEVDAVAGMQQGLKQGVYKALMIEMHPTHVSPDQYTQMLKSFRENGYHIFEVCPDRLIPVSGIPNGYCCALSPTAFQELDSPSGDFLLPEKNFEI